MSSAVAVLAEVPLRIPQETPGRPPRTRCTAVPVLRELQKRAVWLFGLALAAGCSRDPSSGKPQAIAPSATAPSAPKATKAPTPPAQSTVAPSVLLSLDISAYHASVALDDEAVYVLTSQAAYRLAPGKSPQEMRLELSYGAVLTETSILYWSKGGVWAAPKLGGKPSRVGVVPHQPQYFVTASDRVAWVDKTDEDRYSIQTLKGQKPRTIYAATGMLSALAMIHDWVFFVERSADASWRIGGVPLAGGRPAFTSSRTGRTPSMLAAARELYFYDGNSYAVYSLSPDFQREEALAKDVICSPIAVADRVYCANVDGLFEVSKASGKLPLLGKGPQRPITAIAAHRKRVAWISDTGRDKLAVMMLPLEARTP